MLDFIMSDLKVNDLTSVPHASWINAKVIVNGGQMIYVIELIHNDVTALDARKEFWYLFLRYIKQLLNEVEQDMRKHKPRP